MSIYLLNTFYDIGYERPGKLERGDILSKISPVHGSRSMVKSRERNCGPRKTRMRGVSFGRRGLRIEDLVLMFLGAQSHAFSPEVGRGWGESEIE